MSPKKQKEEAVIDDWEQLDDEEPDAIPGVSSGSGSSKEKDAPGSGKKAPRPMQPFGFPTDETTTLQLADFPAAFKTEDLLALFEGILDIEFRIKWIDDTTALAVFANASQAKRAYAKVAGHPFIKVSPYTKQVVESIRAARPQTTDMVARRLIAGALGVRPRLKSLKDRENDALLLEQAKEQREHQRRERDLKREQSDRIFGE
ncbi:hypothetical protein HDV03_000397 [Kappamyces sp. JEL0829]|nr:hypothetical protein HDV03_000397 [Kappamyces sp. JEL0829]